MKPFKFFQRNKLPITRSIAVVSPGYREFIIWRDANHPGFDNETRYLNRFTDFGTEYVYVGRMRDVYGRRFDDFIVLGFFISIREHRETIDMLSRIVREVNGL